ncbi:MAG TPA: acyltransferase family protein [Candidatus Fimivivens faecavium]|nr:acyltransferase family protein [Candidatus Fimivivens faecavium]
MYLIESKPRLRKLASAIVLGLFSAFLTFTAVNQILKNMQENITIYADEIKGGVTYRGAFVGESWYSPSNTVVESDGWIFDKEEDTYTATNQSSPLTVRLPAQPERLLTFDANPDQGKARVIVHGETVTYELSCEETKPWGRTYTLPDPQNQNTKIAWGIPFAVGIAAAVLVVLLCTQKKDTCPPPQTVGREIWADLFRAFCCFTLILNHCTSNTISRFAYDGQLDTIILNSFTALPSSCFFMVSGAYLLRKEQSVRKMLTRSLPKIYVPLLCWSAVYILLSGKLEASKFMEMFYQPQKEHLWFIYSLAAIYLLLPLLSKMFLSLSDNMMFYLLLLLLFIPGLWYDINVLFELNLPSLHFAMFWPDLGLFFFGAILWKLHDKVQKKHPAFYLCCWMAGLGLTVLMTSYLAFKNGSADKYFFHMGSTGRIIMSASVFCLALSLESWLVRLPDKMKLLILKLGALSSGVYFIHEIFLTYLNNGIYPALPLYVNTGTLIQMFISVIIYYILSNLVCWSGKQTPFLKKLF